MKERVPLYLLCLAALLAPLVGGYLSTDQTQAAVGSSAIFGLFGSADFPLMGPCLVILLTCTAFIWALVERRIVQVPFLPVTFALTLVVFSVLVAIPATEFKGPALVASTQLFGSILLLLATVSIAGRNRGPLMILTAAVVGVAINAFLGLFEYQATKLDDPTWRIFGNAVNPNALSGILLFGLFGGISLAMQSERTWRIASAASATLCGVALYLTQSKGGILAAGVGLFVFVAFGLYFASSWLKQNRSAGTVGLGILVAIPVLIFLITLRPQTSEKNASPVSGQSRLTNFSAQAEQSGTFRVLLWKTSVDLIKDQPFGYGAGSFPTQSTRPGYVPMTVTAHQGFLQFAVEYGVQGLLFLVSLVFLVLREVMRGRRVHRPELGLIKAGLLAAIAASCAHNFIDSDLQLFATQSLFFLYLGLLQVLSIDAVTPENLQRPVRISSGALAGLLAIAAILVTHIDNQKSLIRGAIAARKPQSELMSSADALIALAPFDGEAYALRTQLAGRSDMLGFAEKAAQFAPSMKNHRVVAQIHRIQNRPDEAIKAAKSALSRDPNNLPALLMWLEIEVERKGDFMSVYERIRDVEAKPYFQVRAIPEAIPTETYLARVKLAEFIEDSKARITIYSEAAEGLRTYLSITAPRILSGLQEDPNFRFAGEGSNDLGTVLDALLQCADQLGNLAPNDGKIQAQIKEDAELVARVRADLSKALSKTTSK